MKAAVLISAAWLFFLGRLLASDPAHALRQAGRELLFYYGVVPAQVVLAPPDKHPERESGGSLERHLLHASNRLAFALIIAAIIVGSATVLGAHAGPHVEGVPLLGILGFVVAGTLGVAWAVLALRSGKL